jgi:hypothetical protein
MRGFARRLGGLLPVRLGTFVGLVILLVKTTVVRGVSYLMK